MAQGRGSASQVMVLLVAFLLSILAHSQLVAATTYTVGDADGWTYQVQNWTNGKKFKAGDVLVFNYGLRAHNVAVVDAKGYNSCTASGKSPIHSSGHDRITLAKGNNYFICTFPTHCDNGMKIAAHAE